MLIEGPFESDYSLAIVNRRLALALIRAGRPLELHQRDNTTNYPPGAGFITAYPALAPRFIPAVEQSSERIHSRYIYPPFTDRMIGSVRAVHCYGWEESAFPRKYVDAFNRDLHVITVMSNYVREVLVQNGVKIPIQVVGLGADHILDYDSLPVNCFKPGRFHFVHVSSCFPRKGADALVAAFCREFVESEDVRLIIKTFANPHNDIARIVAKAFARYPRHAPVDIIWDSYSPGEMRCFIENSQCLVAASRGEGFGLPVAEAMLLGVPVVATVHGGHADLCSPEWMWPVEFRLAPAATHLSEGESYWAEPDVDSLAARMREVYECDRGVRAAKTARAREHVRANFTWERVALRHEEACLRALGGSNGTQVVPRRSPVHLGFITTWNAKCGIAEYTRYLTQSLAPEYRVSVFANRIPETVRPDEPYVSRCWEVNGSDLPASEVDDLVDRIALAGCDAVSIQHNFGLLFPATMQRLARRLRKRNIAVLATLHGSATERFDEFAEALKAADAVLVHRSEERDRLAAAGLERVVIQRQGIYVPKELERLSPSAA
ncbi:MAG: glycosyltransferase family 4 protein, partial [Bryobacteraceae bacterium]